jgi:hypothetical protein
MKNDIPVQSKQMQRKGYVVSNRGRRPYVSIVRKAGSAWRRDAVVSECFKASSDRDYRRFRLTKTQLRMPVPIETSKAALLV